jgi:hypothetical protein
VVPNDAFKIVEGNAPVVGALKSYDIIGDSGKNNRHWFCSTCGSSLYTQLEIMSSMTVIKAGGLDGGAANLKNVGAEFYVKDRVGYSKELEGSKQQQMMG